VLQQVCCDVKQEQILQVEDRESKRSHASGQNRMDTAFWKASSIFFRSEISRGLRHKIWGLWEVEALASNFAVREAVEETWLLMLRWRFSASISNQFARDFNFIACLPILILCVSSRI